MKNDLSVWTCDCVNLFAKQIAKHSAAWISG